MSLLERVQSLYEATNYRGTWFSQIIPSSGLKVGPEMRPPSYELHTVRVKTHSCETFIVCLVFYGKFYYPSATGTAASA